MSSIVRGFLSQLSPVDVIQTAGAFFNACELDGCQHKSLGFSCAGCSKFVCNTHVYFQFPRLDGNLPKPLPFCPVCVVGSHPELFPGREPTVEDGDG